MAKNVSKKADAGSAKKTPASNAVADADAAIPSKDNDSKYQPAKDAAMNAQSHNTADGLHKLFLDSIKDIYWAENHLVKTLPKMISAASAKDLQQAIASHLEQTKTHVKRLEQVFKILGKNPQAKKCDAMDGLTKEGEAVIESTDRGTPARDLGIIMASQKVEHYEISAYTGLSKLAKKLGLNDAAALLSQTLQEEVKADETLAGIADSNDKGASKAKK